MKKKNVKIVEFLIMLVMATAAASIACFVWFNQTAGVVLAAVAAVAAVVAVVVALVKTNRNRDEQTRKSTYKVDWKFATLAAIAAAALVFIVAIPFAPIKTGWVLIPAIPLVAIAFAVASKRGRKSLGLALAMLLMMVGTTGLTYAAMHDFEFGGETTVIKGDYIENAKVVTPTGDVIVENAENLNAENVKAENLNVTNATIKNVKATEVKITEAKIEKVEATEVNITNANINTMNATEVNITNANIENLNATNVNIENATIAPTETTTKAPAPTTTEPTTKAPAPTTTEPTTKAPVKNPSLRVSSNELYKGGRVIVTLQDCTASDVTLRWSEDGDVFTSRGVSLRHISGNQYDLVVSDELFEFCPTIQVSVGNVCKDVYIMQYYD